MLFTSGSADLRLESSEILEQISRVLNMVSFEVRVEGHTDNIPISTERFPSNWELSQARALSVVRRFIENGVEPSRFQVIGYGEYRPKATNDTPEGRTINRRVEISVNLQSEISVQMLNEEEYF